MFKNYSFARNIPHKKEENCGICKVDTSGYVSRERKVKSLIFAGKRLEVLRQVGAFDVLPGEEPGADLKLDPTRYKGYTFQDAVDDLNHYQNKIDEALAAATKAKKKKSADKAGEGTTPPVKTPPEPNAAE